jgi:hypothetical protein
MKAKYIPTAVAAAAALAVAGSHAATINLIDQGGVTGSPAEQGFNIAAGYWGHMLTNNATINLGVKFAPLNPGIIGSTGSRKIDYLTADWRSAFNATKSSSAIDQSIILPTLTNGGFSGLTTGVNGDDNDVSVPAVQINGKAASKVLYANSSVVKALGGAVANPNDFDGNVTFSSNFAFDFNPSNGIDANTFDFIGVAIHEIGHALGFVSGVDLFDYYSFPKGPGRGALGYDLNDTSVFSALDMFRYSAPGQIDLTVGGTKYFSIDGGASALFGNTFSTGRYNGDGNQASHWKDLGGCSGQLGIMDPNFCFGQMGFITGLDLAAYDAMGWNLSVDALNYAGISTADIYIAAIPEPTTWALMIAGLGLMGVARRARQA